MEIFTRTESLPAEFQQREDALRTEFERKTEQAQLQYERDCRATISEIQGRNSKGISPFSNRIKEFMDGRQCLSAIEELSLILKENEQLENSLRRNLGKVGVDFDVFMQKLDQDNKPII
jgi:hypothetical protein